MKLCKQSQGILLGALRRTKNFLHRRSRHEQLSMYHPLDPSNPIMDELPAGYSYIEYDPAVDEQWISLINISGDFPALGIWTRDTLYETIIGQLIPNGSVLVIYNGELVATTSLCYSHDDANIGILMYCLVNLNHRGMGIGKAMVQRIIWLCQSHNIKKLLLLTDDHRLASIKLYLTNGFLPFGQNSKAFGARWRKVFEQLERYENTCHRC